MNFKEAKRKAKQKPPLVLAIINQKGGVGKSTTSVNLSACLGDLGYKVLLVDLDPQGNSSSGLGFDKKNCEYSTYDCLLNDDIDTEDAIVEVGAKNVWLIPAMIQLANAEVELVNAIARETVLKTAIDEVKDEFDFIFIDCPPSLGLLTINALTAANQLMIPIQCEYYALEGVSQILDTKKMVKKKLNKGLDIFGVVMTMLDKRTTLSKEVVDNVEGVFGDKMFKTRIPRTVRLSEAPSYGEPIIQYDPNGKGADAYRELAKEVVKRYKKITED